MGLTMRERVNYVGSSALRLAAALTIASATLGTIGFAGYWAYTYPERQQAEQAEVMRTWSNDSSTSLGMKLRAKTKLTGGQMLIVLEFDGHPDFLSHPVNQERGFYVEWKDADGFTHVNKYVKLSEFTTVLDHQSKPSGLSGQFGAFTTVSDYIKLEGMKLGWNIETETPQAKAAQPAVGGSSSDHCAPGINRQERLRRLAEHGPIRETGYGEYTAGNHALYVMPSDGTLLSCR
jgi:hypothetical protein